MTARRHPLRARSLRAGGFTLIEVLVALAVVAIALAALTQAGARGLDRQAELEQRTFALWLADNRLTEIRLQPGLRAGVRSGTTRYAGRDWRWRADIGPAPGGELWRIDVEIMQPDGAAVVAHTGFAPR
ncbi:MAG: type II secretion system minor pseudopilin GspI [Candidatus Wenzhouxiangella sp. M2_3B_020]